MSRIMKFRSNYVSMIRLFSSNSHRNNESSAMYCLQNVKRYDYENFICTLLLKDPARSWAFAVRGFNVEVARVAEQVSDNNIGLMRLKFWNDTIDACFSKETTKIPHHPVAAELYKAIKGTKLTKRYFKSLITSREDRLQSSIFPDLDAIEKYAEKSVCSVYYLILESCGVRNVNADHAASHLGKAQGLVQQLRSVIAAKKLNAIPFPQNILTKHHVNHEAVLRGHASEQLSECAFEVASRAHQHLVKARSLINDVPVEARKVLLPAIAVDNYLNRLQKLHHDVLNSQLQKRSYMWIPKLWWAKMRHKY